MSKRKGASLAAIAALLGGLLIGVGAAPASAVGCTGLECVGKSPGAQGCDGDAVTRVTHETGGGHHVDLRHSGACKATWARFRGNGPCWGSVVRVQSGVYVPIEDSYALVHTRMARFGDQCISKWVWSDMVEANGDRANRVCHGTSYTPGPDIYWVWCSRWMG